MRYIYYDVSHLLYFSLEDMAFIWWRVAMNKTKFITIRVDDDLYNQFKSYTNTNFLNGTSVIRNLIQNWVCNNTKEEFNTPSQTVQALQNGRNNNGK